MPRVLQVLGNLAERQLRADTHTLRRAGATAARLVRDLDLLVRRYPIAADAVRKTAKALWSLELQIRGYRRAHSDRISRKTPRRFSKDAIARAYARAGSYQAAAQALGCSSKTVARSIRSLKKGTGVLDVPFPGAGSANGTGREREAL